ncbi:MAG: SAM-dependent methyltransferase [Cytophagales bacterium CG12_big_fil_rev_8_21_14_0_65_40_12]|nr:MAG: SAM-dependent methyltransferase [Cytophagales bacterium CG12_big_fil_rev_8_21_14_0_65_40_12]PIW04852.1 MAG: class I SAM-dependent methyltransferase [Cytophagales bacterium CG17_big_fil_post_rev_8_21_14_2_50_40_13]
MKNNFNFIAPVYDALAKLVFGNKLKRAQCHFLHLISQDSNVLILGGGTGWLLDEIFKTGFRGSVTYVEASTKMIKMTEKRLQPSWNVSLICGDEKAIPKEFYDVIITNFFLDVFSSDKLKDIMATLSDRLSHRGLWFCTDFRHTNRLKHKLIIWSMLQFFRLTTQLEAGQLLDFAFYFKALPLHCIEHSTFSNGLIFSSVYQKQPSEQEF